jgi:hypothetical protein
MTMAAVPVKGRQNVAQLEKVKDNL